jgi:glycosyltransferase involved in cell wall biosynthesis
MRIAIVLHGGVDRSGERRVIPVVLALLARLAARHEVHVFALSQEPRPASWMLCGARVHNIGSTRAVHRAVAALWREHRRGRFDVIHALWAGAGALVAAIASRMLSVPLLVHLTGGELVGFPDIGYGMARRAHWRIINRWVFASADVLTATSDPMVELAASFGWQSRRVPLGIDLHAWPARTPVPRAPDAEARLIQVATLNLVKDPETTLTALHLLRERGVRVVLDFVGEDIRGGAVQSRARELGLGDAVIFHGFRTQRELRPIMERADVHVVSSRHEAGPAVALEAAILGIPTVGTNVGHLSEWAGAASRTVAVGDAPALAREIEALLRDEVSRLELARAAQARAIAEDADFTASSFEALYREVTHD